MRALDLNGLTSIPDGFNPTVGGYLDLNGLTSIPDGFNPTVGGSLYLRGLTSIPEGFNPTVGGSLYLRGLTSIPEGFNPTVGGYLDLNGESRYIGAETNLDYIEWQDGKYILVDGIFCEKLHRKSNVIKAKKYGSEKTFYIITDGEGSWSHGDSIKEAQEDLIFKTSNKSKSDYEDLTTYSVLTFEEAVVCYRVLTGACKFGVKDFLSRKNVERKDINISDIIHLTSGEYGHESFKSFFA